MRTTDVSQVKPQPAVIDSRDLPAMLAVVPQFSRQSTELPRDPKPAASQLPDQTASLKRSASLPSSLATLPAAATGVPRPGGVAPLTVPSQRSFGDNMGKGRLQSAQHSLELGRSPAFYPFLRVSHGLQSALSLPLESAYRLSPSALTAASATAVAAAGSIRRDSPKQGAASAVTASAFQPYNRGLSLGSQGTSGNSQPYLQHGTAGLPGGTAGQYTHTGAIRGQIGLDNKASTVYDKENFGPPVAAKRGSRLNPHAAHMGGMRAPGAVNNSTLSNTRQPGLGPGSGAVAAAQGTSASQAGDHGAYASDGAATQGLGGTNGAGDGVASKRAKLSHWLELH